MIIDDFLDYLERGGLTNDFTVQRLLWEEKANTKTQQYLVIQPNDGSGRFGGLSADDYVDVILVSEQSNPIPTLTRADEILKYVAANPSDCNLNSVFNMGGLPSGIVTTENRTIFRLSFRCLS
ncbi:TPA: phage tail termination protein [Providencia alcalifaciens]